ncbi:hypothetical protein MXM33_02735 [Acinetobacter vivianii]|uniref:hypothetical protein n=1 Tax=Acinetobacter vivianii TaxID=1776742 RepID=UPI002DBE99D4|nr:hypothetical protein [Acinetobacter vivianii]MEB6665948.1 hypothetical protein [Acinetobacter vivianii]
MPQYLRIAEKVYKNLKDENKFTQAPAEYINYLLKQIRKELKGTDMKLIYNFIEFNSGFKNQIIDGYLNIDVSLIPNYKYQDEFVLWLAGFIEKITVGGKKRIPPIVENIPPEFTVHSDLRQIDFMSNDKNAEQIISYFKHGDFINSFN